MPPEPTVSAENYLLAIYSLEEEGTPPVTSRIAQRLRVTPPSVTGMFRRLARKGLVTYGERGRVKLTPKGLEIAQSMVRRHRLAERFLTEVLGIEWHHVHEEAQRLEHGLSPLLEERLSAYLGHPATCPHGNPIPGNSPGIPPDAKPLDRFAAGQWLVLDHITDEVEDDLAAMQFLYEHRLMPGTTFLIREVASFNGTITIQVGEGPLIVLGLPLAGKIWARPAPMEATATP